MNYLLAYFGCFDIGYYDIEDIGYVVYPEQRKLLEDFGEVFVILEFVLEYAGEKIAVSSDEAI